MDTQNTAPTAWDQESTEMVAHEVIAALRVYRTAMGIYPEGLQPAGGVQKQIQARLQVADVVRMRVECTLLDLPLPTPDPELDVLSRFEGRLVDALATAHRDYDHWNG